MKILYGLLVVSVAVVLASVIAMWWRLRRHLRPGAVLKETMQDTAPPEHEPAEQSNLK